MSANGGAAADAAILDGYRHPGNKTGHKISECQIRKKKMPDKEKSSEKAAVKEKSSEKADEKADKKADNCYGDTHDACISKGILTAK